MTQDKFDDNTHTHVILAKGVMVAHYRVDEKIGAGGMGEVFLAEDTKLKRQVALKFLPVHLCADDDAKARFIREARAAAGLNHPNIIHVYEVGEFNGRPYFAMEYVTGHSLHRFAHDDPQPVERIIELAIQLCEALAEAHGKSVVHRDIKAANIIVDEKGRPRLLDFGLASIADDSNLTKTGSTIGTVAYMSPEQVQGKKIDQRSDLFSLGVVLYELLAGRTPFRQETQAATLQSIIQDEPQPLARYRSDVPDTLQQIVSKLLAKNPQFRYQTAEGVLPDLRSLSAGYSAGISTPVKPPRRSRMPASGAVIGILAVLAVAAFFFQPWKAKSTGHDVPMIAVLPFENLGSADDEYFADGMTEEITSRLATIEGLGVISRTSAVAAKTPGKTVNEIGKELGVDYVLEGTVRWSKTGGQAKVRITPQLIRVSDDRHLWADNYERELMEVFDVQADIALQIVDQLGVTLLDHERQDLASQPTHNAQAYEYYLRGVASLKRFEYRQEMARNTIASFDSAIALDPSFALAYAFKSVAHSRYYFNEFENFPAHGELARQAAGKALELSPGLSYAHLAMGQYFNFVRREYDRALDEFSKAQSELHNNSDLLQAIALVQMRQGRFREAQENYRRAAEFDPLSAGKHASLAWCLLMTKDYDEAERSIDRAIMLDPKNPDHYADKVKLYASRTGDKAQMRAVLQEAYEHVDPSDLFSPGLWDFDLRGEVLDSLIVGYIERYRDSESPLALYGNITMAYLTAGNTERAATYADSARQILIPMLETTPDNADLHAALGMSLACLGDYDDAVKEGRKARELLSVDDCHW